MTSTPSGAATWTLKIGKGTSTKSRTRLARSSDHRKPVQASINNSSASRSFRCVWLNLVEVWFGIIERQAIRRGVFPSVRDLTIKIRAFITGWNQRKHPFIWTKTPDQILRKIKRKQILATSH